MKLIEKLQKVAVERDENWAKDTKLRCEREKAEFRERIKTASAALEETLTAFTAETGKFGHDGRLCCIWNGMEHHWFCPLDKEAALAACPEPIGPLRGNIELHKSAAADVISDEVLMSFWKELEAEGLNPFLRRTFNGAGGGYDLFVKLP